MASQGTDPPSEGVDFSEFPAMHDVYNWVHVITTPSLPIDPARVSCGGGVDLSQFPELQPVETQTSLQTIVPVALPYRPVPNMFDAELASHEVPQAILPPMPEVGTFSSVIDDPNDPGFLRPAGSVDPTFTAYSRLLQGLLDQQDTLVPGLQPCTACDLNIQQRIEAMLDNLLPVPLRAFSAATAYQEASTLQTEVNDGTEDKVEVAVARDPLSEDDALREARRVRRRETDRLYRERKKQEKAMGITKAPRKVKKEIPGSQKTKVEKTDVTPREKRARRRESQKESTKLQESEQ